jgi:pimeloyl-[acyl-carrier protein] methyl ester esterase
MKDLVLLHGWGMSAAVFDGLRRELPAAIRTHALDLPGYGGRASPETYALHELARPLANAAPPCCVVLGWSLGALVALAWALEAPEQVQKLVIIAGTPCFVRRTDWPCAMDADVFTSFAQELESERPRTLRRFAALQAHGDENAREVVRVLAAASSDTSHSIDGVLEAGLLALKENDLRPSLQNVAQPTLVIHGARDEIVPLGAAEYLAAALRGARLETLRGAAHAPFVSEPRRVAECIGDFLQ